MAIVIYLAVLFISIGLIVTYSPIGRGITSPCGALPKFSILFLLYYNEIEVSASILLMRIQQSAGILAINRTNRSANHYVISLYILVLFSLLLLIRYHNLKITDILSVK